MPDCKPSFLDPEVWGWIMCDCSVMRQLQLADKHTSCAFSSINLIRENVGTGCAMQAPTELKWSKAWPLGRFLISSKQMKLKYWHLCACAECFPLLNGWVQQGFTQIQIYIFFVRVPWCTLFPLWNEKCFMQFFTCLFKAEIFHLFHFMAH